MITAKPALAAADRLMLAVAVVVAVLGGSLALAGVSFAAHGGSVSAPPAAASYIYWTNSGNNTIGRANIDGSGVNQSFFGVPERPTQMAIDAGHLYWCTSKGVARATIEGSGVEPSFLPEPPGGGGCAGVAVDGEHIYVTYGEEVEGKNIGNVERAKLDGSASEPQFITNLDGGALIGVAVTPSFIYWGNFWDSAISRARLDGSEVNQRFINPLPGGTGTPVGITVDAHYIYWSITYENHIGRAGLDGSEFTRSFITGLGATENQWVGLATDGEYLYWANPASGTIGRAKLNGTEVNENFITGANEPTGVVVTSPPGAPALPKFLLTVSDTGTGKGTVSSEPAGIKCEPLSKESKCTEELEETTKVKLTARPAAATPAAGFKFVKWSGGACVGSEAPTCEFEMPSKATEVKAEFAEVPKFPLTVADTGAGKGTVSSEPAGIKCETVVPLSKCTEGFEEKTKVTLTATPAGGSKFVKWSGGACVGSEVSTCEFEMPGKATEVKAEFAELPTVWLCKPGLANNPCESDLTTTVQLPNGLSFVKHFKTAKNPPIDCFYLYPQVSSQNTLNANLEIDPEQTQVAIDQASRFSQVCKVYAPMYPQFTGLGALFEGVTPGGATIAYDGALAAWRYYLANYNHGRGVVLIGHSLGASTLKQLIKEQIDPNPSLRHRLVSADLLGGQVTVPVGKVVGGDFQHVPACQAAWQTGCVVAYSSFLKEPPEPSNLGRVASPYFKTEPNPSLQILCVNPAALFPGNQSGRSEGDALGGSHGEHSMPSHGDQSGLLLPYQSTSPFPGFLGPYWQVAKAPTPWVSTPGQYSAQCKQANGASWLQLTESPFTGPVPDEVQKLTVSGTSGEIVLFGPEGRGGGSGAFVGFNATHEEVQTALEGPEGEYDEGRVKVFGSMFGKGNVQVTGGPGDEKGTKPYVITFIGSLAHHGVPLLETFSLFGETTATVVEVTHGGDPRLQIAETLGPLWGTHLVDVNIALGNLVDLTAVQARAYQAHRHDDHSG
jgi:Protein of unknown function (DUF3089)/Divergent InlB B-repeat domain